MSTESIYYSECYMLILIVLLLSTLKQALYECTPERCHRYDNNSLIQRIDVLKVGVSRVTVREASELTGEEM